MGNFYRYMALSDQWFPRFARRVHNATQNFSVPAPRIITRPLLGIVLALRAIYYFVARVFFCEPLFKAYCSQYGKNLRTGVFLHWVQGRGKIIIGDNVTIDGKCSFSFAVRYSETPSLIIGDGTGIGHQCSFTVGKQIAIGRNCRIASSVHMFDSPGHPSDPEARLAGLPPRTEEVLPIIIGDNVWIGSRATIYPGVRVGDGSVVAMGAVVMSNVPPNVVVAGNPARQIRSLAKVAVDASPA
jgi:acetyltransferase-like isoleucine patch superfamily enzyme